MAAGAIIEIWSAIKDITPWGALALVLVTWLKTKSSRKIIITSKNNDIFHAEGMSVAEVERLLDVAKDVAVIEMQQKNKT